MAIELTTPEVVPAKTAAKAQIKEIRFRFYLDGQNMMYAPPTEEGGSPVGSAEGYAEWRVGNGDAPNFETVVDGKSVQLTAEDLATIMYLSKSQVVTDPLVPELGATPVDQLFLAIVQHLKGKGLL